MAQEQCPYCDGVIDRTDKACPHCKRALTGRALLEHPPYVVRAAAARNAEIASSQGTKKCRFCAEEIQAAAVVCKHCGHDLSPAPAAAATSANRTTSVGTLGCATILALLFLGYCVSQFIGTPSTPVTRSAATSSTSPAPAASAPTAKLDLLSARGYESQGGGYHIVEGEVQNVSSETLRSVAALATWYAKDGTLITSEDSLIEYDPLLPGQKSPFKVMARTNPAISKFSVTFKHLFGPEIMTDDKRKK